MKENEVITEAQALEWLNSECFDLRCETVQFYDDADIIWHVYSHHMAEPKLRIEGTGDNAIAAIKDAMLPKDDPRRRDYVPEDFEPQAQEVVG